MNNNTINSSLSLWEKVTTTEADKESLLSIQASFFATPRFLKGSLADRISKSHNEGQKNIVLQHKVEDLVIILKFSSNVNEPPFKQEIPKVFSHLIPERPVEEPAYLYGPMDQSRPLYLVAISEAVAGESLKSLFKREKDLVSGFGDDQGYHSLEQQSFHSLLYLPADYKPSEGALSMPSDNGLSNINMDAEWPDLDLLGLDDID